MKATDETTEPDWDTQLDLRLSAGGLIHALFATASSVHTGWSSCVDRTLVTSDISTLDEKTGNYCRLAEQEFEEDDSEEDLWHDWTVELRLGEVIVTGHWQIPANSSPMEWEWCAQEAEAAFDKGAPCSASASDGGSVWKSPTPRRWRPSRAGTENRGVGVAFCYAAATGSRRRHPMKISVDIDISPAEMRKLMGLPDVEPFQQDDG